MSFSFLKTSEDWRCLSADFSRRVDEDDGVTELALEDEEEEDVMSCSSLESFPLRAERLVVGRRAIGTLSVQGLTEERQRRAAKANANSEDRCVIYSSCVVSGESIR